MEISKREVRVVAIGLAVAAVLVGMGLTISSRRKTQEAEFIQEIKLERGETSITLTRDGTLTLRTPDGIFQQQWDDARVREFFAKFERQREQFSAFDAFTSDGDGYLLTIVTTDGSTVTYFIPSFGIDLPDSVEEIIDTLEELEDSLPPPIPIPTPTGYVFPTIPPTPVPTSPPPVGSTPTPTPATGGNGNGTGGDGEHTVPFECRFYDPEIKPDIKSETLCTPE